MLKGNVMVKHVCKVNCWIKKQRADNILSYHKLKPSYRH